MDFDPNNALKSTLHGPLVSDFRPSLVTNFSNLYYVRKEIFRDDAPQIVDPSQDDATMVEREANLEKEGLSEWMQPHGCNYVDPEPRGCNPMDETRGCISVDATSMEGTERKQ
ncbi:hypothetical protein DY000_02022028 [Brassica cretica]|uniref:Methyltransferase n=1 Tax=Brassica cretica TaxID=69181 RepID=A0ABQ7E3F3_BRACR|nr:hypothetical protein DY000_02022028 [Brassica cretica]